MTIFQLAYNIVINRHPKHSKYKYLVFLSIFVTLNSPNRYEIFPQISYLENIQTFIKTLSKLIALFNLFRATVKICFYGLFKSIASHHIFANNIFLYSCFYKLCYQNKTSGPYRLNKSKKSHQCILSACTKMISLV